MNSNNLTIDSIINMLKTYIKTNDFSLITDSFNYVKSFISDINTLNDFMRCDIKFAICSLSPWKTASLTKFLNLFIDNNINIEKDITLLGYPVESKPYNKEISEMPKEIYCIPYLQNPFHITSGYFNFFEMILQRKKIYHAKRQKF